METKVISPKMIVGINVERQYTFLEAQQALMGAESPNFGERDHNLYFYEMYPLLRVLKYLQESDDRYNQLKFTDGERKDDGMVFRDGIEQEIQLVLAIDGQQENIRMEHLKKYGRAPAVQNLKWQGSKNKRALLEQDVVALSRDESLVKLTDLLEKAIIKKIKIDYAGMWLGVVFEDYFLPPSEKIFQGYFKICDRLIKIYLDQIKNIYSKVFFVGTRESDYFLCHFDLA